MLLPDKNRVRSLLIRFRELERRMLADPMHHGTRARFEDVAYTLCILMGQRTARDAVVHAERYLKAPAARLARFTLRK
ncbi:DUF5133 domain-containing protein [Streptomyces sp. NPDC001820]|uniref:DUF5133 domain-containing protein n=1 Tax=Streptomyces sp. NPDC001820 TaxID=3364613 RepID=UPI00369DCFC3